MSNQMWKEEGAFLPRLKTGVSCADFYESSHRLRPA